MTTTQTTQEVFEQFLRGELTQAEAADAIIGITVAHKRTGGRPGALGLRKPQGITLSPSDHARADALMAELDRRASAG